MTTSTKKNSAKKSRKSRPFGTMRIGGKDVDLFVNGIPKFTKRGFLPPGIYQEDDWERFDQRFGWNEHRLGLLAKLHHLAKILGHAGCHALYVGGSFVTKKELPGDFDVVWEHAAFAAVCFPKFDAQDLLHLLHARQDDRPRFWGGHVWLRGEIVENVNIPWSGRPYAENVPAMELLCYNRLASPPLEVGLVKLDPWRLSVRGDHA